MFKKIFHQYFVYANKTLDWLPADTEFDYHENLKNNFNKLKDNGWLDTKFVYKFNSHGFRCDEFTEDDSIMFLGCSNTVGIGIPEESSWTYTVSEQIKLKSVNLGIGGTGPDTAFKLANHYIPQIKPKIVVWAEPPMTRFSLNIDNRTIIDFLPQSDIPEMYRSYYHDWLIAEENLTLNDLKHRYAVEHLCSLYDAKFVYHPWNADLWPDSTDLARDLIHKGAYFNKKFADLLLAQIS